MSFGGDAFESDLWRNPAESTLHRRLRKLPETISGGPLVVLWCGHAIPSENGSAHKEERYVRADFGGKTEWSFRPVPNVVTGLRWRNPHLFSKLLDVQPA